MGAFKFQVNYINVQEGFKLELRCLDISYPQMLKHKCILVSSVWLDFPTHYPQLSFTHFHFTLILFSLK